MCTNGEKICLAYFSQSSRYFEYFAHLTIICLAYIKNINHFIH